MIKRICLILFWLATGYTIMQGIKGLSSALLTFSFYYALWFALTWLIDKLVTTTGNKANYKLFTTILISSLVAGELLLKYVVRQNLTYTEENENWNYVSQYKQIPLEVFVRKYTQQKEGYFTFTNLPYETKTQTRPDFSYVHAYNSLGLRDKEPAKDTTAFTIIGLGDSFTEGVGSPADSTWLKLFEKQYALRYPAKKLNTINAGVSGSDPFFEYALLKEKLLPYKPDMVVLCINQSDITDIITRGGKERFTNANMLSTNGPWWEFFYSFSFIFRSVAKGVFHINYILLTDEQNLIEEHRAITEIEALLNDYKKLAAENNFRPVVVLSPMQWELENKRFALKSLSEYCAKDSALQVIDLYQEYLQYQQSHSFSFKNIYWPTDLHHNPTGYNLWATIVSEKLKPDMLAKEGAK